MDHQEIKAALAEKGFSLKAASQAMNRSYLQLYNTTKRKAKSKYVAQSIAVLLDTSVAEVFPDCPEYYQNADDIMNKRISDGRAKLVKAGLMSK